MDISVLVVNLNNLQFTKDCVSDLMTQDCKFNLTIIDQNSSEEGTKEYFSTLPNDIEFIQNNINKPLNQLWNWFVEKSNTPYICLLNNDVRIAPNFLSSAIQVLEKEPTVGFINHISNNKNYQEWSNELNYMIIEEPYRQGWDLIFRKESYNQIPNELLFFYGDDYIYSKLYSSGMKGAYVLNSPMIHFERSTTIEKGGQRDASPDGAFFNQLNLEYKNMSFVEELSKWKPEFNLLQSLIETRIDIINFLSKK
jgi:GT2 family glycosyltransferase